MFSFFMIQYTLIDKNRQLTLNYPEKEGKIYSKLLLQLFDHVASLVLIVRTSMSTYKTYRHKTYHHETYQNETYLTTKLIKTKLINLKNISNSKLTKITTKFIF